MAVRRYRMCGAPVGPTEYLLAYFEALRLRPLRIKREMRAVTRMFSPALPSPKVAAIGGMRIAHLPTRIEIARR
jgi:hypothetical protein